MLQKINRRLFFILGRVIWFLTQILALSLPLQQKPDQRKVLFILFSPRSGSSHLLDYVNCMDDAHIHTEILSLKDIHRSFKFPFNLGYCVGLFRAKHFARNFFSRWAKKQNTTIIGAKIALYQIQRSTLGIADLIALFPNANFIILYRQDQLRRFTSEQLALKTQQWTLNKEGQSIAERKNLTITPTPEAFQHFREKTEQDYLDIIKQIQEAKLESKTAFLTYEDLTQQGYKHVSSLTEQLLHTPLSQPFSPHYHAQSSRPLSEVITNHDELIPQIDTVRYMHLHWPDAQTQQ